MTKKNYRFGRKSGSGKTTLLDLLSGLAMPETGTIKINNIDIKEISFKEISENIVTVFKRQILWIQTFMKI